MQGSDSSYQKILIILFIIFSGFYYKAYASELTMSEQIEIVADSLEVRDGEEAAIFKGNVIATKGELKIKSDQMLVNYDRSSKENNKIKKIEATGNVFMHDAKESAKSDKGIYFVGEEVIELTGNVTLTRANNVLRGNKLIYDIKNKKSHIEGNSDTNSKKRVKAIFKKD